MDKYDAKKLEVSTEWNGKANVCVHCGRVPETFYVATGHDHTDYDIKWCPCRETSQNKDARVAELEAQLAERDRSVIKANEQAERFEREWYLRGDELDEAKNLLLLAKDVLEWVNNHSPEVSGLKRVQEALDAIDDSKLVEGLILCDAEPVAYADLYGNVIRKDTKEFGRNVLTNDFSRPLYAPRRTEK